MTTGNPRRSRRKTAFALAFCLVVVPLVTPRPARAEPTPAERATARELYFGGIEKRAAGDLQGALRDFRAADSIMGVPTTALKLGEVEMALGLLVEANESLERAARYTSPTALPAAFASAQERARALLQALGPRLSKVVFEIQGADAATPRLALVLDGRTLPVAARSVPFLVNPGAHSLEVRVDGRLVEERTIDAREGQAERVPLTVTLPAVIEPAPQEPLRAVMPMPEPARSAPSTSLWQRPTFVTGLAMAGAGVVVGAVAGGFAIDRGAKLADVCPDGRCPPSEHAALSEAETFAAVSTGGLVVAGVGAALAVGTWLFAPGPAKGRAFQAVGPGAVISF